MPKPSGDSSWPDVLVLAPEAPYPIVGGGPLRTASLIEYFWRHRRVEVITFREPGAPDPATHFPPDVEVHVLDLPLHSKSHLARLSRNLSRALRGTPPLVDRFAGFEDAVERLLAGRRFALGLVEHLWCAPYGSLLRRYCDRLILDLHNIESVLLERSAAAMGGPAARLLRTFAAHSRRVERRWVPQFDVILVTSEADRKRAGVPAIVYPNTIQWQRLPACPKRNEIVFSGNLGYEPNRVAVRWFARLVWPALREALPELRWTIVGKNEAAVRSMVESDPRIHLTGPVASAVETLAGARAAVVPVVSGSGTRVKIIEAWAAGLPVVSTSVGAEGLPGRDGEHLLIADQPDEFAAAVRQVLESADLQSRLGAAGRRLYEESLTWNAAWDALERAGL